MVSAVSNATQAQAVSQPKDKPHQKAAPSPSESSNKDSVELSPAAQAKLAAAHEAQERPSQTAKEANQGDRQARPAR
jgi:hypothetical protein